MKAKSVCVPADPCTALRPVECDDECISGVPYREAVGSLNYLAIVSRPDIAFATSNVSKFLNRHNKSNWNAVKRILSYLAGASSLGIKYCRGEGNIELGGYSDADYANDLETRRSMSGYVFLLSNGPITWSSHRQKLVTMSTTESEYVAAAAAAKESIWLRKLLSDIDRPCASATVLQVNNQSTIKLANAEFHKRTKHIDVRYHFLREKYESGEISIEYVPSRLQKGDIFTKALPRDQFLFLRELIGMCEPEK